MTEAIFKLRAATPGSGEVGLFPVDDQARDVIGKIKIGREVGCDVKQRRNPKHHRLYWEIVKFISHHCPRFENVATEHIHNSLKIATGLVTPYVNAETGEVFYLVRSIAWAAMDQTEFDPWFTEAVNVIAKRWMPAGTTPEAVRKELLAMVDGPGARGSRVA